ncbi:MAG: prolyl oligopeptidase family serine peptidase [Candidatus Omnitrophica bacterium]|nr:prolyl oligopeptidase family serine peptidase [Candidatus Omnitrophota bacterium]
MKKLLFAVIFLSLISLSLQAEVIEKKVGDFSYQLYKPDSYDQSKAYPLIIAFHESTGRGILMIDRFREQAEKKGYLLACPDSGDSKKWSYSEKDDVFRMIEDIKQSFNLDPSKIYLTGFSAGALFTYYLGLNYPERFKAIAPFAGPFTWIRNDLFLSYDQPRQIPVLILQGVLDSVVNLEEARIAKQTLESFGYPVKLRELGGLNHEYPFHVSWIIVNWFESN